MVPLELVRYRIEPYVKFHFVEDRPYLYFMEVNIGGECIKHSFEASTYIGEWEDILIINFRNSLSFEKFKRLEIIEKRLDSIKKLGI